MKRICKDCEKELAQGNPGVYCYDCWGKKAKGKDYYVVDDLMEMCGVDRQTVLRWGREGKIPGRNPLTKEHRYDKDTVDQYLKSGEWTKTSGLSKKRKQHFNQLSLTATKMVENIERWLNNPLLNMNVGQPASVPMSPIGEIVFGGAIYENGEISELAKINKSVAENLFAHLVAELPELSEAKDWTKLIDDDLTREVIRRLKMNRGSWAGKCSECLK